MSFGLWFIWIYFLLFDWVTYLLSNLPTWWPKNVYKISIHKIFTFKNFAESLFTPLKILTRLRVSTLNFPLKTWSFIYVLGSIYQLNTLSLLRDEFSSKNCYPGVPPPGEKVNVTPCFCRVLSLTSRWISCVTSCDLKALSVRPLSWNIYSKGVKRVSEPKSYLVIQCSIVYFITRQVRRMFAYLET